MMLILILLFAAAFLVGFLLGLFKSAAAPRRIDPPKSAAQDEALEKLKREYQNFLSYDGSEQS